MKLKKRKPMTCPGLITRICCFVFCLGTASFSLATALIDHNKYFYVVSVLYMIIAIIWFINLIAYFAKKEEEER